MLNGLRKKQSLTTKLSPVTEPFEPPARLHTAVLFLVFNRPDTTAQVFDAIRQAKPPRLYVAADGPREGLEGEAERIAEVRKIAMAVDWPCDVHTMFREKNLGCGPAVKTAIDWFFKSEPAGIILEDDTVPTVQFFTFCEELLGRYCEDQRVGMIAGTNHTGYRPQEASYIFSKNKACWGWATWQRAWQNMDFEMDWRSDHQAESVKKNMGYTKRHQKHWKTALDAIDEAQVSAWDWQWYFSIASQNQLTIFPVVNMVSNVGFGDDSTHTKGRPKPEYIKVGTMKTPLKHPKVVCPDYAYDEIFERTKMGHGGGVKKLIPKSVKKLLKSILKR